MTLDAKSVSPFKGSDLYICKCCGLGFRYPLCDHDALYHFYTEASDALWTSNSAAFRRDWTLAQAFIDSLPRWSSILDVGCYTGLFLQHFRDSSCYGVEPSSRAAKRAEAAGIKVLADNYMELIDEPRRFDIITAFDVIEHIVSPGHFVRTLADRLVSGGHLIISTGNFKHWTFRLMKHRYYYCAHPEHVVFLSAASLDFCARTLGLTPVDCVRFSHGQTGFIRGFRQFLLNMIYFISPSVIMQSRKLSSALRGTLNQSDFSLNPPYWGSAQDHLLAIYRKS